MWVRVPVLATATYLLVEPFSVVPTLYIYCHLPTCLLVPTYLLVRTYMYLPASLRARSLLEPTIAAIGYDEAAIVSNRSR